MQKTINQKMGIPIMDSKLYFSNSRKKWFVTKNGQRKFFDTKEAAETYIGIPSIAQLSEEIFIENNIERQEPISW